MKRGGPLKRYTRLRPRNTKRAAKRRKEAFGAQARLARLMLCAVPTCSQAPCDPAHVLSRGAGGKDRDVVPLCRKHHQEQHKLGIVTFQARHNANLRLVADELADQVRSLLTSHDCLAWPSMQRDGTARCAVCEAGPLDLGEVRP